MKKTNTLLIAAVFSFTASGLLTAADFNEDIKNIENRLIARQAGENFIQQDIAPVPTASAPKIDSKWWSVSFFGSAHKASAKAALKHINASVFPDIKAAADFIKDGSNDESGHLSSEKNGGPVQELWYGKTPFSKGGVLWNYEHFKFAEAYSRLGTICHLTQDQAVPVHVANIKHGIQDSFEGYYGNDVRISDRRDRGDMEPWAYYQVLQDETRSKLPGWTDPETGKPYWVTAPDAPPFGQDVTYGPWGHYGGRKNRDTYAVPPPQNNNDSGNNNNAWITAHPEIREEQLAISGAVTVSVLESASKRLPPLVQNLSVSTISVRSGSEDRAGLQIKFNVYENRSPDITYAINVYKDGSLIGTAVTGAASLFPPKDGGLLFSGAITAYWWDGAINFEPLPAGNYELYVRVLDADGNTTSDEVNTDDIPDNDIRAAVVLN
ncbi:MAG: hypothetical protein NTY45_10900 [Elusimicrobia bacterium]|nr:hypothetical protein [Elusimicrobiota bacterium]